MPRGPGIPVRSVFPGGGLSCASNANGTSVAQAIKEAISVRPVIVAKALRRFGVAGRKLLQQNYRNPGLLFGGRFLSRLTRVFTDLILVVVKVGPLALQWRLQHYSLGGASHTEDRKDGNQDNGQN